MEDLIKIREVKLTLIPEEALYLFNLTTHIAKHYTTLFIKTNKTSYMMRQQIAISILDKIASKLKNKMTKDKKEKVKIKLSYPEAYYLETFLFTEGLPNDPLIPVRILSQIDLQLSRLTP